MPFLILVLIVAVIILVKCIRVVPQAHAYVIEMFGSYTKTLGNGLHFLVPFVERVANKVSLKEQIEDFPPQPVITKDNVTVQIDSVVYYTVFNPELFTYGVDDPILALSTLTATTLRNIAGELELDETLTSRETINSRMAATLDAATDPWGIKVSRVELKNIVPPRDIQEAMERQMRAERLRRQEVIEAEGHKQSVVTKAEGDKQALILKAEAQRDAAIATATGKAEAIRLVYEAEAAGLERLSSIDMSQGALVMKQLEALKALGDGRATKLVVPTELTASASLLSYGVDVLKGMGQVADASEKEKPKPIQPSQPAPRAEDTDDMAPDADAGHEYRFDDGVQPGTVGGQHFQQRRRPPQRPQ